MKPLSYKGYLGSVDYSLEDGCLHGKILHVNDLVTFEAETVPQLQQAFEEAVDDYLQTCRDLGKEPDRPFRGTFNVRVSPDQHRSAAIESAKHNVSLNQWVVDAIDAKLRGSETVHHHHESHFHIQTTVTEELDFDALRRGTEGYHLEKETHV